MNKSGTQSWAIDSIEESIASIEIDGKLMAKVPQWMLPPVAKEGEVLSVRHQVTGDGTRSTIEITLDRAATRRAHAASGAVPKLTGKELIDPGGDIKL